MDLLKRQKAIQAEMRLKAGTAWENADFIFTNECGHHFDNSTIYRAFKKATTAIGRPDARFHDLRHSYAVAAIQSGDDIKTVQSNLGYATAAFSASKRICFCSARFRRSSRSSASVSALGAVSAPT